MSNDDAIVHLPAHQGEVCCEPGTFVSTRCGSIVDVSLVALDWRRVTCRRGACENGRTVLKDQARRVRTIARKNWGPR